MDFCVFVEPQQGSTYDEQLSFARATDELGFHGFFRSDHYLPVGERRGAAVPPTDAWITLAGLARETSRVRLGTLVSPASLRHPAHLAIASAQVNAMSGGRVTLGIGAGWFEEEQRAYGIPFDRPRFDRFEEQVTIIRGLHRTAPDAEFSFDGEHYQVRSAPGLRSAAGVPRLVVGGRGEVRTPALAGAHADELNVGFVRPDIAADRYQRARAACAAHGRDPSELLLSVALVVCLGTGEELTRRAAAIGRGVAELRATGLAGDPAAIVAKIASYRAHGVGRIYLQFLDLSDLDHLEQVALQVIPEIECS
ncbi:LLM class flavin-dependent oxidoreductase [Cellulomonas taurus]|uniref:LLM class flavin-dependent oxidoreductase n=1 Tax=Cellulomonas taurus TaxID=2729175 RepID=UPI00145CBD7D|nr:LLM class flavin-dependent oxidoreductase [Cellulomonas taurus]